jgi:periplasmic protein TonB
MRIGIIISVFGAVGLHGGFLLFGGAIVGNGKDNLGATHQVELLTTEDVPTPDEPEETEKEPVESTEEPPPDAEEIIKSLETSPNADVHELQAMSLQDMEALLIGGGGAAGDFAQALDLTGGGRIGGTGKASAIDEQMDKAFSLAEIDQKPRAVFQIAPNYPSELRSRRLEGIATIIFVVDAAGKVANPRLEKSTHPAFEKPALDAVKKWKFEPAIKNGDRVACKMRVPIRFQPS